MGALDLVRRGYEGGSAPGPRSSTIVRALPPNNIARLVELGYPILRPAANRDVAALGRAEAGAQRRRRREIRRRVGHAA